MILDLITILTNNFKDGNDRKLTKWYWMLWEKAKV
jgi:hypothetical protein